MEEMSNKKLTKLSQEWHNYVILLSSTAHTERGLIKSFLVIFLLMFGFNFFLVVGSTKS